MNLELAYTPALELARLIRSGELSPVEVVSNALERVEAVNDRINAFCFVYPDEAMVRAEEAARLAEEEAEAARLAAEEAAAAAAAEEAEAAAAAEEEAGDEPVVDEVVEHSDEDAAVEAAAPEEDQVGDASGIEGR